MVFYGSVCRVMWPLMMRPAQVTYVLPDGPVGITGTPTQEVREAYEEVWHVVSCCVWLEVQLTGGALPSSEAPSLLLCLFGSDFCSLTLRSAWCGSVATLI